MEENISINHDAFAEYMGSKDGKFLFQKYLI